MTGVEVLRTSTPFLFLPFLFIATACPRKEAPPGVAGEVRTDPAIPDPWPAPAGPARKGGAITVRIRTEPPHLNLLIHPDHTLARIAMHQIFEPLLREDPRTYRLTPVLADSWEVSPDRRTVTLRLRDGVRWQDGRPFDSADVKFTLDTVLDPRSPATALRGTVRNLRAVETPDARTVILRYADPHYHALHALAAIPILARHVFGAGDLARHPANRAPVGTGPYRFVSWAAGEIVLARWPGHWGGAGNLDQIRYRLVREDAVAAALVRRGEIDLDERAGNDEWLAAAADPVLRARAWRFLLYPPGYAFRVYNTRHPALADRRVRMALTLLTDRTTVLREVHRNLHRPAVAHYPPESPCHDPALTAHPFDPVRARSLLVQAGVAKERPLKLTWLIPSTSKTLVPEARIFQADARRAGVEVALETADWATFQTRLRGGRFEMAALAWFTGVEDDPHSTFHSSQAKDGLNYGGFQNAELDRLLESARSEFDPRRRIEICRRIERILHEEQPYTFLYQLATPLFVSRRLGGIFPSLLGLQVRDLWLVR
jgi:peptide/nickel transport system substrate-binding protein